eukprot:3862114-Prymnesium_polylepis.1
MPIFRCPSSDAHLPTPGPDARSQRCVGSRGAKAGGCLRCAQSVLAMLKEEGGGLVLGQPSVPPPPLAA